MKNSLLRLPLVLFAVSLSGCSLPPAPSSSDDQSWVKGLRSARVLSYTVTERPLTDEGPANDVRYLPCLVEEFLAAGLDWKIAREGARVQAKRFVLVSHGSSLIHLRTCPGLLIRETASILEQESITERLGCEGPWDFPDDYAYKAWLEAAHLMQEIRISAPCVVFVESECLKPEAAGAASTLVRVDGRTWICEADSLFDPGSPGFDRLPDSVKDCVLENEKSKHCTLTLTINEGAGPDGVISTADTDHEPTGKERASQSLKTTGEPVP